jgi:hypothetical protein
MVEARRCNCFFNVLLEIAIRRYTVERRGIDFDKFEKCNQIMVCADDMVIMGRRLQDAKELFT